MVLNFLFIALFTGALIGATVYAYRQARIRAIFIETTIILALTVLLSAQLIHVAAIQNDLLEEFRVVFECLNLTGTALALGSIGYLLFKQQERDRIVEDLDETRAALSDRRAKSELFRRTLRRFVSIAQENRDDFDEIVLEIAANALNVDRAGIWIGDSESQQVECVAAFDRGMSDGGVGLVLRESEFPRYFEALRGNHVLAVSNCWTDPRTLDFHSGYLPATGVTALCDVELDLQNGGRGIICFETVGTERDWEPEDIGFIHAVGDLVLLGYARQRIERTERQLGERDARFRDFSRAASDYFWECDASLRYTFISDNDSLVSTDGSVVGRIVGDDAETTRNDEGSRLRLARMEAREPFRDIAVPGQKHDGSETIVAVSGIPIFDKNGAFSGYRGTGRDILEKHREELVQRSIQTTVSGGIGEVFLSDAAAALVEFGHHTAWIGRVSRNDNSKIEFLAAANLDGPMDRFSYTAANAPCAEVVSGKMIIHEAGVADTYPEDTYLRQCAVEGYGGVPLRDEKGSVIGLLAVMTGKPIRDPELVRSVLSVFSVRAAAELNRIRAEEERNELQRQLLHSQRLETMGALAGGIAHDFNNILTPILGYSEMLMHDFDSGTQPYEDAEAIYHGAQRAKRMVEQILAFSRRSDTDTAVSFRVDTLIRSSVKFMAASIPASIDISVIVDDDTPSILGDPGKFDQVLMNLITNAYHAIGDEDGRIEIRAKRTFVSEDFALIHPPLASGTALRVDVSDTGCGIPTDVIGKIFEPYFTTKGSGRGTGFGLSTCRGIVDAMHGTILVDSAVGKGTAFSVLFPAEPQEIPAAIPGPTGHSTVEATRRYRVVYVDDEVENNAMALRFLERAGHSVRSFDDPELALLHLEQEPDATDVLVTDDSMPKLQGWELAARYRAVVPNGPVVVVSGGSGTAVQARYAKIGKVKFIQKPFVIGDLIDTIEEAAAAHREQSDSPQVL